ncbi:hypothetical protein N7492_003388 [Penicillium capsulatum]|uniref:Uncharacterized protein n=1 Tax=Penicillium capsulatum TaxID=69766 RepID=A0A9W9IJE2_9EURO|nr:hypothetical protein N7492_003388 [Penicillium capsulatum]KAJ6122029.1 hypothetical protein N7512_004494 [Penicillium capsulatum]
MGRLAQSPSQLTLDDLPPPYSDEPDYTPPPPPSLHLSDSAYLIAGATNVRHDDRRPITLSPLLSRDSDELHHAISLQMKLPPRPLLKICGSHSESSNDRKQKGSTNVTDFDFQLDLAETMLTGWEGNPVLNWRHFEVVRDADDVPAYRGGIMRSRAYKAPKKSRAIGASDASDAALLESDAALGTDAHAAREDENLDANLRMWCERFCADPSPVKSFTLHRHLHGFDHQALSNVLTSHIRSLNYRGSVSCKFVLAQESVSVYSPHWINRLRANRYIWWVFVLLQLWIISWPVIWLMEKRYEVVDTRWYACLLPDPNSGLACYARNRNEAELGEFWAPAVKQAAWSRRRGDCNVLTRLDAERLHGVGTEQLLGLRGGDSEAEQERRARVNRGEGGFVDSVVGLVRGISEVGQDWRLSMGWGANS